MHDTHFVSEEPIPLESSNGCITGTIFVPYSGIVVPSLWTMIPKDHQKTLIFTLQFITVIIIMKLQQNILWLELSQHEELCERVATLGRLRATAKT